MKALVGVVGAFNQEKALVEAFSVIVEPMDRFAALFASHIPPSCSLLATAIWDGYWKGETVNSLLVDSMRRDFVTNINNPGFILFNYT